jgi:hypothetical protein
MKKIHEHLMNSSRWYKNWHDKPYSKATHYIVALAFALVMIGSLLPSLKVARSSFADGVRHNPFAELNFNARMNGKKALSGEEAITALGDDISQVATHYGLDKDKLEKVLKNDKKLKLSPDALLFYDEDVPPVKNNTLKKITPTQNTVSVDTPSEASIGDGSIPTNADPSQIPDALTFVLHSRPEATAKIFLNFKGTITANTPWNNNGPITSDPFSWDGSPAFDATELNAVKTIWRNVAEDFSPFSVDVTTEQPLTPDLNHYIQVIISPSHQWYGNSGGVSFIRSFRWGDGTPSFVFTQYTDSTGAEVAIHNLKNLSEATTHEVGHTLGLYHISPYDASCNKLDEYSYGSGSTPGWGPIMGAGYYVGVTQWANTADLPLIASTIGCTVEQNDIAIITAQSSSDGDLRFAADEAGNTTSTAGVLKRSVANGIASVDQFATLTQNDTDLYRIDGLAGDIQFTVSPMAPMGTLLGDADFQVRLLDSNLAVLAESNPDAVLPATVSKVGALAGTYYLEVTSSGYLDPSQAGGYTTSGSMGQYQVLGSYVPAGGDQISPVASLTAPLNGTTLAGTVTLSATATDNVGVKSVSFYADTNLIGTDPTAPFSLAWNTSSVTNGSHTLTAKAADAAGNIGASNVVNISVNNPPPPPPDTTAPIVTVKSPVNGENISKSANVTISATATDNIKVTKMEVYIDGALMSVSTTSSISYKWDTRKLAKGPYNILVKGYDQAGNIGQVLITVTK